MSAPAFAAQPALAEPSGVGVPAVRPGWWQRGLAWGAGLRAGRVTRALATRRADLVRQEQAWRWLAEQFSRTSFGRMAGITADMSAADFAAAVPPRRYEEFAPWVEAMKRGEADVLWPGRCAYYAVSSGTTQGRTKYLPVTAAMLAHFRRTGLDSLCLYAQRSDSRSVFLGRHLFLGGSTALARIPEAGPFDAWAGDLSGITAAHLPGWAERHLYEPGGTIAQMSSWPEKLDAIAERTASKDIRLLAGIPSWVLIFAEVMRQRTGRSTLKEIWPNLECLVHGGVPLAPYAEELRAALGDGVAFHEVYPASEAFIAAQDRTADVGLRLFAGAGIYYEFLPMDRFDETRLACLGGDAVPLAQVEVGRDYALLLTTPGGLCRYVIGDIVRFTAIEPPRLIYVGRTRLQLSAFGEHVIEKEVTDALTAMCARRGLVIGNFHVAPLFVDAQQGRTRGRHEWWIELRSPGAAALDATTAAVELDRELQRLNDDYEAKRGGGGLDLPLVRVVPEGTFERWLRGRGRWGGQNKMPRCRSDRQIADELAVLARW